ncbi:unnamed protein product [Brachionus calyciflorus]|uniref:Uncharacterized protein n=1 Tax=Brachionus calyciflorus TaxID=104777 RepID=A0A814G4F8_9BILA|nr:unnamed protein product [Brachionus calyciflorus]
MHPSYKELLKKKIKSNIFDSNKNKQEKSVSVPTTTSIYFKNEESKFALNNLDFQDLPLKTVKPLALDKKTELFDKKNNTGATVYVTIISPGNGTSSIRSQFLRPSKNILNVHTLSDVENLIDEGKSKNEFFQKLEKSDSTKTIYVN